MGAFCSCGDDVLAAVEQRTHLLPPTAADAAAAQDTADIATNSNTDAGAGTDGAAYAADDSKSSAGSDGGGGEKDTQNGESAYRSPQAEEDSVPPSSAEASESDSAMRSELLFGRAPGPNKKRYFAWGKKK